MPLRAGTFVAVLLVMMPLAAQEKDKRPAQRNQQDEIDKLQGEWVFEGVEQTTRYTVKGNEYTFTQRDGKAAKVTFKIDSTKAPKEIELTGASGNIRLGIYRWDGDTLLIYTNISSDKSKRPMEYKSKPGEVGEMTWKRVKK